MTKENHGTQTKSKTYEIVKRIFDILLSIIGIILLSPLMLLIAYIIFLDTHGPVFYLGIRTGYQGLPFKIFKFSTMVTNAEKIGGLSAAKDDPRVTRSGRFLRKYKLNEIPQLFNVLKGDMSFVGPRPEHLEHTQLYTEDEKIILTVRPGITDYASVHFFHIADLLGNDDPDRVYAEQIRPIKNSLRIRYVLERNIWVDIAVLLQTIIRCFGVYVGKYL